MNGATPSCWTYFRRQLLFAWLFAFGCRASSDAELREAPRAERRVTSAHAALPSSTARSAALAPPALTGNWLENLGDDGLGAVVTLPLGTRLPRRLVVGVHGAGDRPEWSCGGWRLASGAKDFVLCPRGSKMDPERFAWASSRAIDRSLSAALVELKARYGRYLSDGPGIYAGFSQGATLAEPLLRARAQQFPIAILAEGGYTLARSATFARAYREAGGRRIVLVCGSPACFASAARAKPTLERARLQVLVVGDPRAGHNLNERMQVALRSAWPQISAPLPE